MQEINVLLNNNSNLLFLAPTGWGKTTMLMDLIKNSEKTWVYLAPLRALANEFYLRSSANLKGVYLISHYHEVKSLVKSGLEFKLLVITPELLDSNLLEKLPAQTNYVFDEIHLFYYWGESFRPRLRECFEEVMSLGQGALCLSATMSQKLLERWQEDMKFLDNDSFKIEISNHALKKDPAHYYYVPRLLKKIALEEFIYKNTTYTKLIFCAYREEVLFLEKRLVAQGFKVISCLGGEAHLLNARLEQIKRPDFILGTSAISHGVNLPKISMIYLSYSVENFDFWLQMIGRGGRQGEEFEIWTLDKYRISAGIWILSLLYLIKIKFYSKIFPYELRRYFNSQNSI